MKRADESADSLSCDVLVVGSGAGGLSAAIAARWRGLDVLIVEKEPTYGGTTARSGGVIWVPCNSLARLSGVADSVDLARTYLRNTLGNHYDQAMIDAFLLNGPKVIDAFQEKSAVRFELDIGSQFSFSDYFTEIAGSLAKGRSLRVRPFDGRRLGKSLKYLAAPLREQGFMGMAIAKSEADHFYAAVRSPRSALLAAKRLAAYFFDLVVHGQNTRLVNGNALAAGLATTALDLNVPMWLSAPLKELIRDGGTVRGAIVLKDGKPVRIETRRGVVLATGGYPHDASRREIIEMKRRTRQTFPILAPSGNSGDGIRIGESVGAVMRDGYTNHLYWSVVSSYRRKDGTISNTPHVNATDRSKPGFIAVSRQGRRFFNECSIDVSRAMVREAEHDPDFAAFLVCDHPALRRYGLGAVKPFPLPIGSHLRNGYLKRGQSLRELATSAGIDPGGLEAAVDEFNKNSVEGKDPLFHRGESEFDRLQGDPSHLPNSCLGPIVRSPFYAVRITPTINGTFSGLRVDQYARALDIEGRVIPGLYCVGSDMANVMGGEDPGAGITLGPAMTFGYIAANHMADDVARDA